MQYRSFGTLDWKPSALGFGCMRLPILDGDRTRIDEPEATRMIRYAIDNGVNYVDTAYLYHGGNSERFVGRVLQDGYRQKVKLATKLPTWLIKQHSDFDRYLDEQLAKLQTDHIDFYLLHSLNKDVWPIVRDLGVLPWAENALADGRIRHLGFSFHDTYETFQEIVDAFDWTFCQIQYNFMDIEHQAGTRGLRYAASKGMAVVVMEPIQGGRLVDPPQTIQEVWDAAPVKRSPADWALQWLWDQPEVSVVLSGMTAMQHVVENVASASVSQVDALTDAEKAIVTQVRARYQEICPIPCTKCEYCMPCPNGVNIPRVFELFNHGVMYNKLETMRARYAAMPEAERADMCIQCHECESLCPQHIPISDWLERVQDILGEGQPYEPLR